MGLSMQKGGRLAETVAGINVDSTLQFGTLHSHSECLESLVECSGLVCYWNRTAAAASTKAPVCRTLALSAVSGQLYRPC